MWVLLWVIIMVCAWLSHAIGNIAEHTAKYSSRAHLRCSPSSALGQLWRGSSADCTHHLDTGDRCMGAYKEVFRSLGALQGYLMQILSVKLGVATGTNMAQQCR